ncbi:hypothetical protein KAR91_81215 [Candidatus Pacearchaeota archaeon]|nr:hypothetical protein [Candidatus Pacearchaeota archaeon]
MPERIPGGYYIKARVIKNKKIHYMPPHVREIWDYCLREANYSDSTYGPYTVKRGQLFRDYSEIREDLCWFIGYRKMMYDENQTKKAMKALRDNDMVLTKREPGGVLITVLNYDYYQDPNNYERTNESTSEDTTKEPLENQGSPTSNKKVKKEKELEERKSRLLQSLKEGMIQIWQYLEQFPEPGLKQDAIDVIISLRKVRDSLLDPGKVEIETLIHNWLFGGVEKDILLKMIKGASTDEFETKNLTIEYILKPKHREKLLMKAEEVVQEKTKNSTEAENIKDHQLLIRKEKEENEQYFLATIDQKLKIVLKAITGYGPYQSIIKEDSYREEIQKRINNYIKSNNTDRSTVMIGVNDIITTYLEELIG